MALGQCDVHVVDFVFFAGHWIESGCGACGGVNSNQGAEGTLSFLLSLLAIVESHTIADKIEGGKGVS